jgi:hypothetical protein
MQALDSFTSPVPSFDDDILILTVLVSAYSPSDEPTSNPSAGVSASGSKTRVGKQKAATNPAPQKKAKKATERSACGIKINEPTSKAPTSTPPSGPQQKISI